MFLEIRNLTKTYRKGTNTIIALDNVDLDVSDGEFLALTGPSGSGKTTLLNILGGLDETYDGTVMVEGQPYRGGSERARAAWRAKNVGFVFQFSNLIPYLTAAQNVELPLLLTSLGAKARKERVTAALSLVGLSERCTHMPKELSGGQEQRVAIARAFVGGPQLILCDEPTGDLDRASARSILQLLQTLCAEFHKSVVMVTHDEEAAGIAHRRIELNKGLLREALEPQAPLEASGGQP